MRRRSIAALIATTLLAALYVVPPAGAQTEGPITANLTDIGTRSITAVLPITLDDSGVTELVSGVVTNGYNVVVTEVTKTGNNWGLNGKLCRDTSGAADCGHATPDVLVNGSGGTIDGSEIDVTNRDWVDPVVGLPAGTPTTDGSATTLDGNTGISLLSVTENAGTLYNGVYTATGEVNLDLTSVLNAGTYTGYFVVTLT